MAKQITIIDILTKVVKIFKNDIFIIDNMYIIGGQISEERNDSNILLILSPDKVKIVKESFPDNNGIYIKDIASTKKDLSLVNTELTDKEKEYTEKYIKTINDLFNENKEWKTFDFSDEVIESIFEDGHTYELFHDTDEYPNVIICKTVFPEITTKNAKDLLYNVIFPDDDYEKVYKLITTISNDFYQMYNVVNYIEIEK